jgi:2-oxo-4-hydroxy-4-carboxy-5-ureidoimidazoline decarboxylase
MIPARWRRGVGAHRYAPAWWAGWLPPEDRLPKFQGVYRYAPTVCGPTIEHSIGTRMTDRKWTVGELNELDQDEFVRRLGFVFEGSPWIAAEAWYERPFGDLGDLHRKLFAVVEGASLEQQQALIAAHPDLVGQAALRGTLAKESTGEQAAAGLDPGRLSADEVAEFAKLNAAYRERFGFPFVICARENKKEAIVAGFRARLDHDRQTEIDTALAEIAKICWYRLVDVVAD